VLPCNLGGSAPLQSWAECSLAILGGVLPCILGGSAPLHSWRDLTVICIWGVQGKSGGGGGVRIGQGS
jgi:hypothetical protein